jgi:hypothetical protein
LVVSRAIPSGRAGGASPLSRSASQPKALIPIADDIQETATKIADCLERVADDYSGVFTDEDAEIVAAAIILLRTKPDAEGEGM